MLKHPHKVPIEQAGELEQAVEDVIADGEPRMLVRDGKTVAVIVSPDDFANEGAASDIWANYDPDRVKRAFDRAAEAFKGVEIDDWKREIKAARGQDSIGRPGD